MLHHGAEGQCGGKGDAERVGDGEVVLGKGILFDVQTQAAVEVEEEHPPQMVAFLYDDGVLVGEVVERGKGGAEHRVCRHKGMAARGVKLGQAGLYGGDVAEDAAGRQVRQHGLEGRDGVLDRGGVDDHFGVEGVYFGRVREPLHVVCEAQLFGVRVVDGHIVVKGQQVAEKRAHFAGSEDEYTHGFIRFFYSNFQVLLNLKI